MPKICAGVTHQTHEVALHPILISSGSFQIINVKFNFKLSDQGMKLKESK